MFGWDNKVTLLLQDELAKHIDVQDPTGATPSQSISLQSLLINYLVDLQLIKDKQSFANSLLSVSYLNQFYVEFTSITNKVVNLLNTGMNTTKNWNIIIVSGFSVLIISFFIPIYRFNTANKKKHEQIYSLMASIEAGLIID